MRRGTLVLAGIAVIVLGVLGYAMREYMLDDADLASWWRPAWTAASWGCVVGGTWLMAWGTVRRHRASTPGDPDDA